MRKDGRRNDQLRPIKVTRNFIKHPEGSVLIEFGDTKVICNASIEEKVPPFLKDTGQGWITAEYSMLPRATASRSIRESSTGKIGGRTQEIQRLIGRSLRAVVDLNGLGERTIWIDCDVIQADGGTRTASITGGFIALADALHYGVKNGIFERNPLKGYLAAVSVGVVDGEAMLDLCYEEDFKAEVDMNVVMTDDGRFVEIQGTAEGEPFKKEVFDELLKLAEKGISEIIKIQKEILNEDIISY